MAIKVVTEYMLCCDGCGDWMVWCFKGEPGPAPFESREKAMKWAQKIGWDVDDSGHVICPSCRRGDGRPYYMVLYE